VKPASHILALIAALACSAVAQVPGTLKHALVSPLLKLQTGAWFGYSVAVDGIYTVTGSPNYDAGAQDSGMVKVFDSTTGALFFVLLNPSPANLDRFGSSVAISGTRVVVGTAGDDTGATDAGSAYVYDLASATPTVPVATFNNPSPTANGNFGNSVAISGTRVVVGARNDDTGATDAGSAYVYDLSSGTPTVPVAMLNNPSPAMDDRFGNSVAISGSRVVVGAPNDDTGASDAGSVYAYDLASGTPTVPVYTLNNPGPAAQDYFGTSVATSGTRVMVGVPADGPVGLRVGNAYVYDLSSGTPTVPVVTLNNPSPGNGDQFGSSVAISGTRVVVGAHQDDTRASNAGIAHLYDLASATPAVRLATIENPSPASGDLFGSSVAISGTRIVLGAYLDDTGATDAGSVYVYDLSSGAVAFPVVTLNNPGPATSDEFGLSVAISGTRVVVGAYADSTGEIYTGSAYVYDLASATPMVPVVTLNNPSPAANDAFGFSVAISGTRVVVGAYNDSTGATNAGSAYVYDLASSTPAVPVAILNNPSPAALDRFGSVAISGTRVVVGAAFDDTGATNAGSVYVYDLSSGTPTVPVVTLNNPTPTIGEQFGYSVAISGTQLVVGSQQYGTGSGNDPGSAYVYNLASGTPAEPVATLNDPPPASPGGLRSWVAIDATIVAIGAPGKGYAYVFGPASNDTDGDGLLDIWEYARFGSTAAHSALDDADGDGRVELIEQAFDTNPLVPNAAGAPVIVNEGGFLTTTIAKRAGVTYSVETGASPDAPAFSTATTMVLINNATTLKVRDTVPIGTPGSRFMRVKVTAAP
jgi:FG-GAP repeat